jgi:type IV pilus assembly protein PilC
LSSVPLLSNEKPADSEKKKKNLSMKRKPNEAEAKEKTFAYSGYDASGNQVAGKLVAMTFNDAKFEISRLGLSRTEFSEVKQWWNLEFGRAVPLKTLLQATRQLASFAQAGIPIIKGIGLMARAAENARMRSVFSEIKGEIEGGSSFSEAVSHHPNIFPRYYSSILASAEKSGDLETALTNLSFYIDRDLKSSRAIKSAMYYPLILIGLTVMALLLITLFVLPRFKEFFATLDANLPLTTRLLLGSTDFVRAWYPVMFGMVFIFIGSLMAISRTAKGKLALDKIRFRLPIFGGLIKLVVVERFCRVLATLVKSQVPLTESLDFAAKSTGSPLFVLKIEGAKEQVIQGGGLTGPLSETKLFPTIALQIFEIGEESGQLDSQLSQAAGYYGEELDHRVKNFTSLIEPIVLLIVGGGIAFMSIALISAMYSIFQAVQL